MHINTLADSNINECDSDILRSGCVRSGPSHTVRLHNSPFFSSTILTTESVE